ncbi:hypothetical protein GCM10015535_50260 [Streptomyces gelaticus]|uniref:Uncharacterized protein n=1 Tax=Streptomyces gelaticus TaxID=285446 RepID=A0ABQ2W3V0_9ACTN|nr:hypothetical protein GCM10015535_50260 [Streptomyces gelaticus]
MSERAARSSTGPLARTKEEKDEYGAYGVREAYAGRALRAPCWPGEPCPVVCRVCGLCPGSGVCGACPVVAAPPELPVQTGVVMSPR